MATTIKELVEGTTERQKFYLTDKTVAGVVVAVDGSGLTVADLLLTSIDGTPVNTSGKIGWDSASDGVAYFDPDATDLAAQKSPYRIRFKLTDVSSKIRFYPSHGTAEVKVVAQRQ